MRSRGLVVAIAVVLAVLAAVGVIVYTNSVKNGTGADTTAVIVSSQDIPANTPLNPLIDQGVFGTVNVPNDTLVSGAVTDENELGHRSMLGESVQQCERGDFNPHRCYPTRS